MRQGNENAHRKKRGRALGPTPIPTIWPPRLGQASTPPQPKPEGGSPGTTRGPGPQRPRTGNSKLGVGR
eukprot:8626050-Alexandrium_andersonii.AAC.1